MGPRPGGDAVVATRLFNGNTNSEDGWPYVDQWSCNWVVVPGTSPPVNLQIQAGQPTALLRAWAADWNAYLEPLRDADSACWTEGNSVATSNHPGGTAVDLNWESHPFQQRGSFNADQMQTISEMEAFYEGTVFWAGRWDDPVDEMHSQMGGDTFGNPHTQDFIDRKIRPDGFSTFRREGVPVAPPAPPSTAAPTPQVVTVPLVQNLDGTWTSPSPAWAHMIMRESGGNPTIIQQIVDVNSGGNEAEGLFQITPATWRAHGGDEFAPSARPATPQQQAIVAARIFTANPSGSDWGAGLPGRENADELAAGLVPLTEPTPPTPQPPEEPWMADPDLAQMIRDLHDVLLVTRYPSLSRYGDDTVTWTIIEYIRHIDAFLYNFSVQDDAELGSAQATGRMLHKAATDPGAASAYRRLQAHMANKDDGSHWPNPLPPAPNPQPTPGPDSVPTPGPAPSGSTINTTLLLLVEQMQNLKRQITDSIGGN